MPIRTKVLAYQTTSDVFAGTVGTVPAGKTWIVKNARITNVQGAPQTVMLRAVRSGVGGILHLIFAILATGTTVEWSGFFVMGPGDSLFYSASFDSCTLWVSGSELAGVA